MSRVSRRMQCRAVWVGGLLVAAGCGSPHGVDMARRGPHCVTVALPTGDVRTSVLSLEQCGPVEVTVDRPFEYVITVRNLTKRSTLHNVTVVDWLPGPFQADSESPESARETPSTGGEATAAASPAPPSVKPPATPMSDSDGRIVLVQDTRPTTSRATTRSAARPRERRQPSPTTRERPAVPPPAAPGDERAAPPPPVPLGGPTQFEIGDLRPGEARTIHIRGVATGTEPMLRNCVTASYELAACLETAVVPPQLGARPRAAEEVAVHRGQD